MKILLAKPFTESSRRIYSVPPYNLGYLASALRGGHEVEILDCELLGYSPEDFEAHLRRTRPDVVGLNVFSHNVRFARRAAAIARATGGPGRLVLAGGPHVGAVGARTLADLPEVDYAIAGEAEISLPLLLERLAGGGAPGLDDVPGLIRRGDGGEALSNLPEFTDDVWRFAPPSYDLMDLERYFRGNPHGVFARSGRVVPIITSRGCPFPCTFCSASLNSGKRLRYRPLESVLDEIDLLVRRYRVGEIHIDDDNFTFSRDYVLALCEALARRPYRVHLALPNGIRADRVDEEILGAMRRAGFYQFSFGIESGSDETLRRIRKLETAEQMRAQVQLAKRMGFRVTGFFIIGFPWETREDVLRTLAYARSLPLDHASFNNFSPFPGTAITRTLIEAGEIPADYEVAFIWGKVGYHPRALTAHEVRRLQRRCFLGFYIPRRIPKILRDLRLASVDAVFRRVAMLFR